MKTNRILILLIASFALTGCSFGYRSENPVPGTDVSKQSSAITQTRTNSPTVITGAEAPKNF